MPPGSRAEGMQVFPGLRLRMLAASFCFCVPGKYAAKQMCRRRPSFVWPGCRASSWLSWLATGRQLQHSLSVAVPSIAGYRDLLLGGNVVDAARYNAEALLNKVTLAPPRPAPPVLLDSRACPASALSACLGLSSEVGST